MATKAIKSFNDQQKRTSSALGGTRSKIKKPSATGTSSRQTALSQKQAAFSQNMKATKTALGGASTGGRARKTSPTMSKYTSQLTPATGTSKKKAIKKPY